MNRKSRRFLRILALCMAVVIGIGMLPVSVSATETGTEGTENSDTFTHLALGDSITAGYGLTEASTEGFVAKFASEIGATTTVNLGVSGLTAEMLAAVLNDPTNEAYATYVASIAAADVITITIGGNDLMEAFYEAVVIVYNSSSGGSQSNLDVETVKTVLANPSLNATLFEELLALINGLSTDVELLAKVTSVFTGTNGSDGAIATCVSNISSIVSNIRTINSDAVVLVANQYNPYQWLGVEAVSTLFSTVVGSFNSVLFSSAAASTSDFIVVDVCSAFNASTTSPLTNASITYDTTSGTFSYNFDFHPNATGHSTIATAMKEAYYYTWEIPLQLTARQIGSVAVPSQTFEVEILLDLSEEPIALATIYGTLVSKSVSVTDGAGTYNASLTFTGNANTVLTLDDGFYVRMVDGGVDGWTYDDAVYYVSGMSYTDNKLSDYDLDQTSTVLLTAALNSSLQTLSFECSYTGWHLYFETNDGSSIDSVEAVNNTTLDLSAYTPTRYGYTFSGWYSDKALTDEVDSVTLTSDTTVYAGWTENTYTWTAPLKITAEKLGSVDVPTQTFEVEIYDFSGEAIDVTEYGGEMVEDTVSVTGEGTYTGTLTFTGGEALKSALSDGFVVALKEADAGGWTYDQTEYYVIVGFAEASEGIFEPDEIYIVKNNTNTETNGVLMLAATYTGSYEAVEFACSYTGRYLNFEANGGSSVASVTAVDGQTISLSGYTTSRSGYDFTGWYADNAFSTKATNATMNGDVTVYAGWTEVMQTTEEPTEDDDSSDSSENMDEEEIAVTAAAAEGVSAVSAESADTGDDSHIVLWAVLVIVLGAGVAALTVFQRKRH